MEQLPGEGVVVVVKSGIVIRGDDNRDEDADLGVVVVGAALFEDVPKEEEEDRLVGEGVYRFFALSDDEDNEGDAGEDNGATIVVVDTCVDL